MSFILDALKKSENERQRSAVPGINDLPVIVRHSQTSGWMAVLVAALSVVIVALGFAWWRASAPEPAAPNTVAADRPADAMSEARQSGATQTAVAEPQGPTRDLAAEARLARPTATPRPTQTVAPAGAAPSPSPTPSATVAELRATGVAVPNLTLELHVFSDEPGRRFVFINSRKYVEGETLQEGPRLVAITTEGAILSQDGRTFLLPQE
jgi:general secretion pathway protein B